MSIRVALFLLALCVPATNLAGQQRDSLALRPGDLVRLAGPEAGDNALVLARIVQVSPYEFDFALEDQPGRVYTRSYTTVTSIDVGHRNARESARSGALWGLFLGAATGFITAPFFAPDLSLSTGHAMGLGGAVLGLVGAAAGAGAGAMLAPLRWNRYVFE